MLKCQDAEESTKIMAGMDYEHHVLISAAFFAPKMANEMQQRERLQLGMPNHWWKMVFSQRQEDPGPFRNKRFFDDSIPFTRTPYFLPYITHQLARVTLGFFIFFW